MKIQAANGSPAYVFGMAVVGALILSACGGGGSGTDAAAADAAAAQAAAHQAAQNVAAGKVSAIQAIADATAAQAAAASAAADAAETQAAIAAAAGSSVAASKAAYETAVARAAEAAAAGAEAARLARAAQTVLAAAIGDATVAAQAGNAAGSKAAADAAAARATVAAQAALRALSDKDPAAAAAYAVGARGIVYDIDFHGDDVLVPVAGTALSATVAQGANAGDKPTYTLSVKDGAGVPQFGQVFTADVTTLAGGAGVGPTEVGLLATTPTAPAYSATTPRELGVYAYAATAADLAPSHARLAVWKQERRPGGEFTGFTRGIVPFGNATPTNLSFLNVAKAPSFKGGTSLAGMLVGGSYQPDQPGRTHGVDGRVYLNVNFSDKTVVFATALTDTEGDGMGEADYDVAPAILTWDNRLKVFTGAVRTRGGQQGTVSIGFYGSSADEAAGVLQLKAATGHAYLATGFLARTHIPADAGEQAHVPCATRGSTTVIPSACP